MKQVDFLAQLEFQAKKQAVLHEKRLIPRQLDWFTSLVGNYPWQTILTLSLLTAVLIEAI